MWTYSIAWSESKQNDRNPAGRAMHCMQPHVSSYAAHERSFSWLCVKLAPLLLEQLHHELFVGSASEIQPPHSLVFVGLLTVFSLNNGMTFRAKQPLFHKCSENTGLIFPHCYLVAC